jgi:fatty acid desaturase
VADAVSSTALDAKQPGIPKRREFLTPLHGALNIMHVIGTHALLIAWLWLGARVLPVVLYVPLSLLACLVHQRAMSEWIHEGAHFNLVANRRWNDRLTNALAGVWFALPVREYRNIHFAHHAKQGFFVPDDPDTVFLEVHSRRSFWCGVLRDLSGLTIVRQFRRFRTNGVASEWRTRAITVVVHLAVLFTAFEIGRLDAVLLYYVTLATLYPLLNRLRTYGQHVTIDELGNSRFAGSGASRTIDAGMLDRIVHTSPRLMYHHEHHLHPHLPYRALRHLVVPSDDLNRYVRSRSAVLRAAYRGLPQ